MKRLKRFLSHFKPRNGKNVIRKKLLGYFLISAVLVNAITLFTYNNTHVLINKLNAMFLNDIALTNLSNNIESVETSLKGYLMTSHSEDLKNYLSYSASLQERTENLQIKLSDNKGDLLLLDIKNMIRTYLDETDAAVKYKRGTNIDGYNEKFNDASTVYGYINNYIDKLKIYEFQENNENYVQLDSKLNALQFFSIIVIIAAVIGNVVLILLFAFSLTEPILKLSKAANQIAEGNFDLPEVKVNSNDEIKTLAVAFNRMTESIHRQMVEIQEKALIESRLREQEMKNLKMKSVLVEAQLGSLQAQIDPHYMFNTLNAGMQLAMFEEAERTQMFMQNLSQTLRYSLGNIKKPATLFQEIENIDQYIYLLKVRFGEKMYYEKAVDEPLPDVMMPRMILQPIVENAFTHGIAEKENGGTIRLSAYFRDHKVYIRIADDGIGMREETIRDLLTEDYLNAPIELEDNMKRHFSIGLRNVIGRLILFYHLTGPEDVIEIKSIPGKGTAITLKMPIATEEVHHV